MGTWGPGNFDNDSANDYVDEFSRELADKIEQFFAGDEDECDFEEEGEGVIIPTVEILAVICEECSGLPPAPDVVAGWKTKYLRIYDENIDYLSPTPEQKSGRRKVIEETFDRLGKEAQGFAERVAAIHIQ